MPAAPDVTHSHDLGLGMVNPSRRVKRLRELALKDTSSGAAGNTLVSSSPSQRAPTPPPSAAAPRRRGRKPAGPLSKSAREQLRKTNHSVIEKRRREKINEALAALRELVPNDKHESEKKEEKEFKLEVLVRTVEYLRSMVDKVKNLEGALCQNCGGHVLEAPAASTTTPVDDHLPRLVKRKRVEYAAETLAEGVEGKDELDAGLLPGHAQGTSHGSMEPQPRARLPSISSWMNDPTPGSSQITPPTYQLPSPPHTAPFAPITIASTGFPPRLVLPPVGPNAPSMRYRGSAHQGSPLLERTSPSFASRSPFDHDVPELPLDSPLRSLPEHPYDLAKYTLSPPLLVRMDDSPLSPPRLTTSTKAPSDRQTGSPDSPWSRDDQTAASLLLNISSRHSHSGSDEEKVQGGDLKSMIGGTSSRRGIGLSAQTPRSLLGMAEDSGSESSAF